MLGVRPAQPRRFLAPEQLHLLETFANQVALALERVVLAEDAQRAQVQAETEQMRSSLLSSVSHDLRTPLAAITGATSTLREGGAALDQATREELIDTAYGEAERLNRLVGNLLDMTRIEAGGIQVQKEWQPIEEVIGAVLARLGNRLGEREVRTNLPDDLLLVPLDSVLIEQVFINLLENALKYTSLGSPIDINATATSAVLTVEIADRGPGIPLSDIEHIFDKFYRVHAGAGQHGVGLGLAICRGIVEAHGGRIWAENRAGGGARFQFTVPIDGAPPRERRG